MPVPRFYVPADLRPGSSGRLDPVQARQVRSVLRLPVGSTLVLFNGTGLEATARILDLEQSGAAFEVEQVARPDREPPLRLTVGLALLRGDRFDRAVQKLTEIGVARIVPLLAERCVVTFPDARAESKRLDRYRRIAREAAEQSERVTLPEIAPPRAVADYLRDEPVIALVERADSPLIANLPLSRSIAIAVGPEGGWTDRELELIEREASGCASLGRLILRAETAAVVCAGSVIGRSWDMTPQRLFRDGDGTDE